MVNKKDRAVDMDDLLYAVNYAAKHCELGISGIAEASAQQKQTLRNKLTPGDVSHTLTLADFVMVIRQADDTTPLDVLCSMFGGQFISRSNQRCETIMLSVLNMISGNGDLAETLNQSMEDDEIDDAEWSCIHRRITEGRNSLIRIENTVNAYRKKQSRGNRGAN